jgi:uncharacterized protein YoxC
MEMSVALQVGLFLASLAIIVLVACVVPLGFQTRRNSEQRLRALNEFKSDAHFVKQQTEELIQNLNELSRRANQQMDDIGHIVRTARQWTDRVDRLVEEVEPPVFALAPNLNLLRAGVGRFLQVFLHSNHRKPTQEKNEDE